MVEHFFQVQLYDSSILMFQIKKIKPFVSD
jgi:hypothetical protein